ncbi:thiolase family protein [Leptospira ellisii]|uniref:Acetyl-CoA acetyltransferase n=1 Tax=Leptospira ellisii TaxID=2023197 RepID=A0A2N0B7C8_9LEPT|nr:thiolase family protein [Leptospira ellisii]MDV6235133.1 thiolase family protein [Leptospira ellisii]PJZ92429.1 acetyl-CoA acetyltransferase [Leptospira ellisii]PKA03755.1 acetyl-CoA acetyltransferase [Leptospira ellisii]
MSSSIFLTDSQLSKFGKTELDYHSLSYRTASQLLRRNPEFEPQFLVFAAMAPERYTGEIFLPARIKESLGLKNLFTIRIETASSSGASALHTAVYLLRSGAFQRGIVIATEVMSRLEREANNLLLGSVLSERQRGFAMSMAQGGGMIATRYLHEHGYDRKDLFALSKKLHDNGLKNENAHIRKNITEEEYFNSPVFTSPLCLYDISPLSDGCAAALLSSEKTGSEKELAIRGIGHGIVNLSSPPGELSFASSVSAFQAAYAEAGLKPEDISIAELHDAFTPFELICAEDAGLFPRGKALRYVKEGKTHPDGQLPVNASGGLKTRGHPVGVSGLAQIAELQTWMFQRDGFRNGLALSIGGLGVNNFATILGKE